MKYQLSISLLVSNHIDTIRRCLESIKPLLTELRSELIIVDTGSTDGSIEVAKEYADKIVPFTWCNDFSAARNAGLKEARGEWFLYLDDDEWFEDVREIIHFFKKEKYMDYGRAFYVQRNYENYEGTRYSDSYVLRMFQIVEGTRFKYRIHELVTPELNPLKVFDAYVHHYGYIGKSEEKNKRNVVLLEKELEENPKEMRMFAQLINECCMVKDYAKVLGLKDKLDAIKRGSVNDALYCYAYAKMAESYLQIGQAEQAVAYAEELLQKGICNPVTESWLYIVLMNSCMSEGVRDNEKLLETFDKYMSRIKEQPVSKEEFSKISLFGMGKVFGNAYAEDVVRVLCEYLYSASEWAEFTQILGRYGINLVEEGVTECEAIRTKSGGGNVSEHTQTQAEVLAIKQQFLQAIQTLLDAGQVEAALQAVEQAAGVLGEDPDIREIKAMLREELGV